MSAEPTMISLRHSYGAVSYGSTLRSFALALYSSFLTGLGVLNDVFIRRAFSKTNNPGTVRDVFDTFLFFL